MRFLLVIVVIVFSVTPIVAFAEPSEVSTQKLSGNAAAQRAAILDQLSYTPTVGLTSILKHFPQFKNPFPRLLCQWNPYAGTLLPYTLCRKGAARWNEKDESYSKASEHRPPKL